MKLYLLTIYQPDGEPPPPPFLQKVEADAKVVTNEMKAAGVWVFSGGLHLANTSTVVKVRDGEAMTTDGPYLEGKEHVGGFLVIRSPDLDAALAWARKVATAIPLPIEVRPFRHHDMG